MRPFNIALAFCFLVPLSTVIVSLFILARVTVPEIHHPAGHPTGGAIESKCFLCRKSEADRQSEEDFTPAFLNPVDSIYSLYWNP